MNKTNSIDSNVISPGYWIHDISQQECPMYNEFAMHLDKIAHITLCIENTTTCEAPFSSKAQCEKRITGNRLSIKIKLQQLVVRPRPFDPSLTNRHYCIQISIFVENCRFIYQISRDSSLCLC